MQVSSARTRMGLLLACGVPALAVVSVTTPPLIINAYYGAAANETSLATLISSGATSRLTHLTYAFATTDGISNPCTGVPTVYPGGPPLINTTDIQNLRKQNPNVKILISIGGAQTTSLFENAIVNEGVNGVAQSCVTKLLGSYPGFIDGIDIDWEYPSNTTDAQNFSLLLQAFRSQLNTYASEHNIAEHLLLTVAVPPEYQSNGWLYMDFTGKTYAPGANNFVDFYNVEFYDYAYNGENVTSSNAPLTLINDDIYGNTALSPIHAGLIPAGGMPASKLVVGIPFYGVEYTGDTGAMAGCQLGGPGTLSNAFTYGDIMKVVLSDPADYDHGCTNYTSPGVMNDSEGSAWSWNSSTGVFYEYDNPTTISQKNTYVTTKSLAGEFTWNLEDDTNSTSFPGATAGVLLSSMLSQTLNYSDVSGSVSVTTPNGLAYNKLKHTASQTFVITNNTKQTISGPIQLVLWQLPQGVTASGNGGFYTGSPYWTVTSSSIAAGASAQVTVTLSFTGNPTITPTASVFSGAF